MSIGDTLNKINHSLSYDKEDLKNCFLLGIMAGILVGFAGGFAIGRALIVR